MSNDRGSTIPLILGFFLVAALVVAGSIALGDAFVQQRDLQDVCDGAASAAAASALQLERGAPSDPRSLKFGDVEPTVTAYLARDPQRGGVRVHAVFSADRRRLTLTCEQTRRLVLGDLFGHAQVHHVATSSARAAVLG